MEKADAETKDVIFRGGWFTQQESLAGDMWFDQRRPLRGSDMCHLLQEMLAYGMWFPRISRLCATTAHMLFTATT